MKNISKKTTDPGYDKFYSQGGGSKLDGPILTFTYFGVDNSKNDNV